MSRSWKSRVGVLALTATMGIGLVGIASPAGAAAGGNSANAQACQNNGWKTLFRADGTAFKNTGDCVSYAAHGGVFASQCYDSTFGSNLDFRLVAPINTAQNTARYGSTDGTCSGAVNRFITNVSAADQAAANAECQALVGTNAFGRPLDNGYTTAPSDWWTCI